MTLQDAVVVCLAKRGYKFTDPYERLCKCLEEELELLKAVRVHQECVFDSPFLRQKVIEELADRQITNYLLAEIYEADLDEAVKEKLIADEGRVKGGK